MYNVLLRVAKVPMQTAENGEPEVTRSYLQKTGHVSPEITVRMIYVLVILCIAKYSFLVVSFPLRF